jgi:hypothetical protein
MGKAQNRIGDYAGALPIIFSPKQLGKFLYVGVPVT